MGFRRRKRQAHGLAQEARIRLRLGHAIAWLAGLERARRSRRLVDQGDVEVAGRAAQPKQRANGRGTAANDRNRPCLVRG